MAGGLVRYNARRTADFIRKNGVTVRWERGIKCPCLTDDLKPSLACMLCFGHGYAYPGDEVILMRGLLTSMQSQDPITQAGLLQTGEMQFTPPAGVRMDDGDRLTLLQFDRRESEVVDRGSGDREALRHLEPIKIVAVYERREVAGEHVLHRFDPESYRLEGRSVVWVLDEEGSPVDAPARFGQYTVQYDYRPKYMVHRLQDPRYRGAQDATMPQSVNVKFMTPLSQGRST